MPSKLAPLGVLALAIGLLLAVSWLISSFWWYILAIAPIVVAYLAYEFSRARRRRGNSVNPS
jgi:membrane protein implicated in regulation of membrane protease activity